MDTSNYKKRALEQAKPQPANRIPIFEAKDEARPPVWRSSLALAAAGASFDPESKSLSVLVPSVAPVLISSPVGPADEKTLVLASAWNKRELDQKTATFSAKKQRILRPEDDAQPLGKNVCLHGDESVWQDSSQEEEVLFSWGAGKETIDLPPTKQKNPSSPLEGLGKHILDF